MRLGHPLRAAESEGSRLTLVAVDLLVAFLSFSPIYILLVLIVVSASVAVIKNKKEAKND